MSSKKRPADEVAPDLDATLKEVRALSKKLKEDKTLELTPSQLGHKNLVEVTDQAATKVQANIEKLIAQAISSILAGDGPCPSLSLPPLGLSEEFLTCAKSLPFDLDLIA